MNEVRLVCTTCSGENCPCKMDCYRFIEESALCKDTRDILASDCIDNGCKFFISYKQGKKSEMSQNPD